MGHLDERIHRLARLGLVTRAGLLWGLLDGEQPVEVTARKQIPLTNPMRSLLDAGVGHGRTSSGAGPSSGG